MLRSIGILNGRCVPFMICNAVKLLLSLVLIDVSVSNPLNCKMGERFFIAVVTSEVFVLNVCEH